MFAGKTAINKTSNPKAPYLRVFLGTNKTPKQFQIALMYKPLIQDMGFREER